ncbi:MAG: transposase, partial [Hyphomicrobiales bacterium]|nr:transposase [Hyphomicrobiales bacterium]
PLQLSLFDDRDLAEISDPRYPGERLIVCRNPLLAAERSRKREALLQATEADLTRIAKRVKDRRRRTMSATDIGLAVGAIRGRKKMAKHFVLDIRNGHLSWTRNRQSIAREAQLDGIYVVRTSLPADDLDSAATVQAYKDLSRVERAFRCLKTSDLEIRPVRHWTAQRVRAHVFLCMLAYHVEWHLTSKLAPILFHDTDIEAARAARSSPVVKTKPSSKAK